MARDLAKHRKHLEELVEERTSELESANEQLQKEIAERKASEKQLKQSRERLRDLASHLESIREEERSRIAREIHDELGQALTALKMDIHWVGQRLSNDQGLLLEKTKSISNLIDTTTQSVQRISSELRPGLLDDLGLSAAVEWQTAEFQNRTGIPCEIVSDPEDISLDHAVSTAVFRVFQEALTNIARHAGATEVKVVLKKHQGMVQLIVRDNGKGVTEEQIADERSFGLIGMRERVHHFGGDLRVSGVSSQGTTVTASIPIHRKGTEDDKDIGSG
jgi:signal transduction histidine kinase